MQLQEGWFSYVNTHLILFAMQSTESFIPMFKMESFAVQWQRISEQGSGAAALCVLLHVNITGFIHLMLPEACFGVNAFLRD